SQTPKRQRPEPNGFDGPDGYKTHGINEPALKSPEGRALVEQYKSQGMQEDMAILKSEELLSSGRPYPKKMPDTEGDKLQKGDLERVPHGKYTADIGTEKKTDALKGLSY